MINGKGLLCRYIIQAQLKSTNNTHKYALLASLVNCEVSSFVRFKIKKNLFFLLLLLIRLCWYFQFSEIGMLLLRRCVHIFFCGYRSQTNDRLLCFPILKLIAHLINYSVVSLNNNYNIYILAQWRDRDFVKRREVQKQKYFLHIDSIINIKSIIVL